jgi:hypothetical protein
MLDLAFTNCIDFSIYPTQNGIDKPDSFRLPFAIDFPMQIRRSKLNGNVSFKRHSAGDYELLYNTLSIQWNVSSGLQLSVFVFLLGTYLTFMCSVDPPATALQVNALLLLLMQRVNRQIFL